MRKKSERGIAEGKKKKQKRQIREREIKKIRKKIETIITIIYQIISVGKINSSKKLELQLSRSYFYTLIIVVLC